ncbi:flagellar hook-basal body protein [Ureibacillus sp. FSL K6-8385]|uniref:Flagellar hook-basal body protein n=1 Tax=Ureibacillus terrenus TaxID=118246 RepID=A0A540V3U9_9BACL|nr:flagellar hook-basal body protein [Ureibacillus terrenus]MED3661398.1 flagellar hook-basal body protein [Ureibacillus terrenus]MED3764129.1 flagellar hook-basal body protein [Ureibacillus terrenus]TQE90913.1 flagellar hook-basal body protein [Ureibacillus terrenus]
MFKGIYTAASGMLAQQRKTEILTNNMANANTPGYKAEQTSIRSFPEMLMSAIGDTNVPVKKGLKLGQIRPVGNLSTGIYLQETMPNFNQGAVYETEFNTDFALIDGELPAGSSIFFRLSHPNGGEAYTRNGNFTLDGQGYLVTGDGYYVLSDTGARIQLPSEDFQVTEDGSVYVGNRRIARIGVAFAQNANRLVKEDNGLFRTENGQALPSAYGRANVTFGLKQRHLEGSNVDAAQSMAELLTAYRAFEANQKVVQAYDRSMDKAVNEIGKV